VTGPDPTGPALRPVILTGLLLLDPHGYDPTIVNSVVVDDSGIGVTRHRGDTPRLLPWDAVVAHAVEPWSGGTIPARWIDPEGPPSDPGASSSGGPTDVLTVQRHLPHAEAGALISVQTRSGTYRFLRTGGDAIDLSARIDAFAVRHQGPTGRSTVTTVAPARQRRGYGGRSRWARARPYLVVLLVVLIVAAVTVILLQSAGVIHLPVLGGSATPSPGPGRVPA